MHQPLTIAITGIGRPRMVIASPSMRSFHMYALVKLSRFIAKKSPPAENDLLPLPVTTAQTIDGSSRVDFSASIISSSVCSRNAFSTRSRLMVIHATWSFTS